MKGSETGRGSPTRQQHSRLPLALNTQKPVQGSRERWFGECKEEGGGGMERERQRQRGRKEEE